MVQPIRVGAKVFASTRALVNMYEGPIPGNPIRLPRETVPPRARHDRATPSRSGRRAPGSPQSRVRTPVPFRDNKLFRGIDPALVEQLAAVPQPVRYEPEAVVFREGDPADCFYLIYEGSVRISKRGRGSRQETLTYLHPGDFFGEMGVYDRAERSARATAVGAAVLGRIDREGFETLFGAAPVEVGANLLRESVVRLRDTDSHFIQEILEAERLSLIGSMLSGIVHDIRGPLSVIRGAADLLEEEPDPHRRKKYTRFIRRGVDRVSDMAQELLDYSKGATRLNSAPVSMTELAEELREEILDQLPASGVEVVLDVAWQGRLVIDRNRIYRVLLNLIRNAVEAMPGGGRLSISIENSGDHVCFTVADTGVGIPSELLPSIFEPFVSYGKAHGTGLGMAITRSVVEAHQGRITVESTPGAGTTFVVHIPATLAYPVRSP
jgi:signal transduction histidine kinase